MAPIPKKYSTAEQLSTTPSSAVEVQVDYSSLAILVLLIFLIILLYRYRKFLRMTIVTVCRFFGFPIKDDCCQLMCPSDSAKLLIDKGNDLKLHQKWPEAGETFESAAQLFSKASRYEHETASNFAEAANCFRKLKNKDFTMRAVQCLDKAGNLYAEIGQFSIAARHLEDAGDLARTFETWKAVQLYKRASDFWSGEDSPASAAGSRSKAAHLLADIGKLDVAAMEFEQLGESAQRHSLLEFGAKDHMFRSSLCLLCIDPSRCSENIVNLVKKCEPFSGSDEHTLVMQLAAACSNKDIGAFDSAVAEFERLNNVDDWVRRRLHDIRRMASGAALT